MNLDDPENLDAQPASVFSHEARKDADKPGETSSSASNTPKIGTSSEPLAALETRTTTGILDEPKGDDLGVPKRAYNECTQVASDSTTTHPDELAHPKKPAEQPNVIQLYEQPEFAQLSSDCDGLRRDLEAERRRREHAERDAEAEKQRSEALSYSSAAKILTLEKALSKAQAQWMALEVDLTSSQVEISRLQASLDETRATLADAQDALSMERERRMWVAGILQKIAMESQSPVIVPALASALGTVDELSLVAEDRR